MSDIKISKDLFVNIAIHLAIVEESLRGVDYERNRQMLYEVIKKLQAINARDRYARDLAEGNPASKNYAINHKKDREWLMENYREQVEASKYGLPYVPSGRG